MSSCCSRFGLMRLPALLNLGDDACDSHFDIKIEENKTYSWDLKRQNMDTSKFIIEDIQNTEVGRVPGEISGEQFVIQNCENSNIYLFDHINTVTIDDCKNCKMFIGPTKGAIFLRDCSDCVLVVACGQFRTRDCRNIETFLCCSTQPIIESTVKIRFSCFQYNYPELEDHFIQANLSPYNNFWWNIHDFTPVPGQKNWSILGGCYKVTDFLPLPGVNKGGEGVCKELKQIAISCSEDDSVVPLTVAPWRSYVLNDPDEETSLVLIYSDPFQNQKTKLFLQQMLGLNDSNQPNDQEDFQRKSSTELLRSMNITIGGPAESYFGGGKDTSDFIHKPTTILQFCGLNSNSKAIKIAAEVDRNIRVGYKDEAKYLTNDRLAPIHVSADPAMARKEAKLVFDYAEMEMGF